MAFETLSEKFSALFKKMRKEDKLTEANVESAIREIRIALLEADVNFKVVKAFTEDVREKALGQEVLLKVNPSQQFIKICHDELVTLLGQDNSQIKYQNGLTIIMLVGLQGSGKTTSAGKLAYLLKNKLSKKPLLAGLDVYRPAAIDQLGTVAKQVGVDFFNMGTNVDPVEVAKKAVKKAADEGYDVLILDTAGRLQIDEKLMDELKNINKAVHPDEVLLLVILNSSILTVWRIESLAWETLSLSLRKSKRPSTRRKRNAKAANSWKATSPSRTCLSK